MIMNIVVLKGDGIGPEIVAQGHKVLNSIAKKYNHELVVNEALIGGSAIDSIGTPLPDTTIALCKNSDAILLGAVGGPKWDHLKGSDRPETGLLNIRKELGLFANIRPAKLFNSLKSASPLKEEIVNQGLDICIVRELTGGIYFGDKGMIDRNTAYDTEIYSKLEIERIAHKAFTIAQMRNNHVTSIDKMNVLMTSRLWRDTVNEIHKYYPDVKLDHMLVDNAAMQLVSNPSQFDVILTSNMFGDILSDEASMLTGSLGMLPSASLGNLKTGIFEPIHGSAPDLANTDKANPIATILSVAMMLRYSFNLLKEADAIENAVTKVLEIGYRTTDIYQEGNILVGTEEMGDLITSNIV